VALARRQRPGTRRVAAPRDRTFTGSRAPACLRSVLLVRHDVRARLRARRCGAVPVGRIRRPLLVKPGTPRGCAA
jgi:hypothetical protein